MIEDLFVSSEFYTTIKYIINTTDGYSIPTACFNPNLMKPWNNLCAQENKYLAQSPAGYIPSFIDLKGNYSDNFSTIIISALQRMGIQGKGKF